MGSPHDSLQLDEIRFLLIVLQKCLLRSVYNNLSSNRIKLQVSQLWSFHFVALSDCHTKHATSDHWNKFDLRLLKLLDELNRFHMG
jgi:hypothetical protein